MYVSLYISFFVKCVFMILITIFSCFIGLLLLLHTSVRFPPSHLHLQSLHSRHFWCHINYCLRIFQIENTWSKFLFTYKSGTISNLNQTTCKLLLRYIYVYYLTAHKTHTKLPQLKINLLSQ